MIRTGFELEKGGSVGFLMAADGVIGLKYTYITPQRKNMCSLKCFFCLKNAHEEHMAFLDPMQVLLEKGSTHRTKLL